jgi:N6-adenosine-specific RNA methylase IME4
VIPARVSGPPAAGWFAGCIRRDLHTGTGFTTRKNAEYVVLCKRGKSLRRDAGVHEIFVTPRREHSRKPDELYLRIERYVGGEGPFLELFARQSRPGWTTWGLEKTKFDPPGTSEMR